MSVSQRINDGDVALVERRLSSPPETESVAGFVAGPGIERLSLTFDIDRLRSALEECLRRADFMGGMQETGFAAAIDEVFEGSQELFFPLNPTVNFFTGDKFRDSREALLKTLETRLEDFERLLGRHDGAFFFGREPVYCDFGVFHHIDLAHFLDGQILEGFPAMQAFMGGMSALPGVSGYLAARPELVGVSVEPKLVIDGTAVSTGMSPD